MFRTVGFKDWENATGEKRGTFKMNKKSKTHVSSMYKADNLVIVSHEKKLDINRVRRMKKRLAATVRLYLLSLTLSLYYIYS